MNCIASIATIITAIATIVIAVYAILQYKLIQIKRKDDLFNVRYKFYKKVIKFILELMEHALDCKEGVLSGLSCRQNPRKICEHLVEEESFSHTIKKTKQDFVEEARLLFGDDIADYLKAYITVDKINSFLESHTSGDSYWYTYSEFIKPFEKHLRVD